MDRQMRIKTLFLFKCLLLLYIVTLMFTMHKLHDDTFEKTKLLGERELDRLRNRSMTVKYTPTVVYKYRNVTKKVYVNQTIEKIIYVDKIIIPRYFGPGENGSKVKTIAMNETKLNRTEMEIKKRFHGFDTLMSDTISLHRKLPDLRPPACRKVMYPRNMPAISVVIIFRDEWHSVLLRTAYSVLEMSPPELLKEVVLVDDGSTNPELIAKVDLHIANVKKFRLVRNKNSLGLMGARQKGIENTRADYFIVMDGHMEVAPGWLEPLVYRLTQEPNALLCSHIGVIRHNDFEYYIDNEHYDLFDREFPFFDHLTLDQMWASFSPDFRVARNKSIEPLPYGTVQGMMIAMRKEFFNQLGGFDTGMKVWGSEQMELSVKVWTCGGRVEMIPCSKVAHMYRYTPWGSVNKTSDYHAANKARMIDVWLDQPYRDYVYQYIKDSKFVTGDLTERHRIRAENHCKPYQFFIDTVKQFSDVYIPENPKVKGAVYNEGYKKCLDNALINDTLKLITFACHGRANQFFLLTEYSEIRTTKGQVVLAITSANSTKLDIQTSSSRVRKDEAKWNYTGNGSIRHVTSGLCLKASSDDSVILSKCSGRIGERWKWGYLVKK